MYVHVGARVCWGMVLVSSHSEMLFLRSLYLGWFWRQSVPLAPDIPSRLACRTVRPRGLPVSGCPEQGLQPHATIPMVFYVSFVDGAQILLLAWEAVCKLSSLQHAIHLNYNIIFGMKE